MILLDLSGSLEGRGRKNVFEIKRGWGWEEGREGERERDRERAVRIK